MKFGIAFGRATFVIAGLVIFVMALAFGEPIAAGNTEAIAILVTAFSILAGFLLAIATLSGDPTMLYPGTWRIASAHRRQIARSLSRYRSLFFVYLAVIALALLAALVGNVDEMDTAVHWIQRCAISAGIAGIFWSFGIPTAIIRVQLDRLTEEVRRRRNSKSPQPEDN